MLDESAAKNDPSAGRLWVVFRNDDGSYVTFVYQISSYDTLQHALHGQWVGGDEDGNSEVLRGNALSLSPLLEQERPPAKGFSDDGTTLHIGGWSMTCVDAGMQARLMSIRCWHKAEAG